MRSTIAPPEHRLSWIAFLHLTLLLSIASAQMPYNPTRLLQNGTHLYVFQPSASSAQFQLNSIDLSAHIDAANPPLTTLCSTLPFLNGKATQPFTPVIDETGDLTVYTGNCSQGASGGQLWRFFPESTDSGGIGSWSEGHVSAQDSTRVATMGANYLNNGISFSKTVGGDDTSNGIYLFGGMCPFPADDPTGWQATANYSNLMVTLEPSSKSSNSMAYQLDIAPGRGPPIPEAGFTMTGLTPTFANRSDGSQTQQRNFILVGGHTSSAFINMSQIALFSLPEEGWTFITVEQPDASQRQTDLTIRDTPTVDPRSGHTAVLTPDGQKVIIFGGWVGDIETPAEPQLAILNIADGYGGKGDWKWTVPDSPSGAGIAANSGIYGHGATMLPGGVMMIMGGYSISGSGARRRDTSFNSKTYFLNTTSNTWMTDYTPPNASEPAPSNSNQLSSLGQKAGLGIGIGMGLVFTLFAFYMWYTKRLKKQRDIREKQLQDLSLAAHRYNIEDYPPRFDDRGVHPDGMEYLGGRDGSYYFPPGNQGGQGWKSSSGHDAERTGLLLEIPSPTRGLRRGISGRPGYAMVPNRGPGPIHPIDELEEEDEERATDKTPLQGYPEMNEHARSALDNAPGLDPFTDTYYYGSERRHQTRFTSSSPTHGGPGESSQSDIRKPSENAAIGIQRSNTSSTGKTSADKSSEEERTGSNLSEKSAHSNLSYQSSHGDVGRSPSMHATTILNTALANPFRTPDTSPTHGRPRRHSESGRQVGHARTQSAASARSGHTNFAHLQVEGEMLLGGNPERQRPGTSSTSKSHDDSDTSHSRAATATPATSTALDQPYPDQRDVRKSWLGSVRRVLRRSISGADRTRSLTTTSYHEPYSDNPTAAFAPSKAENRKSFPASLPPRRAASDASFWKSKRGKQDWEDEYNSPWARTSGDDWGAPEDIALAEKERQRQKWRDRGNLLVNLSSDSNNSNNDSLPTPRTPIQPSELGFPTTSTATASNRPVTPAEEGDWDVEAAVERRVVQVMFTVPKSKLRVVNADPDGASVLSLPQENTSSTTTAAITNSPAAAAPASPSKVKDLASRFERLSGGSTEDNALPSARPSPVPSPSPSIRSVKIRARPSTSSLGGARQGGVRDSGVRRPLDGEEE